MVTKRMNILPLNILKDTPVIKVKEPPKILC